MGRVRAETAGGSGAEQAADARRSRRFVGSRHPPHQHPVPKGQAHPRVRQGLARANALQGALPAAPEPVLVDASKARRQAVEPEQLPHRRHPSSRRRGRYLGAHAVQRDVLPHVGRSLLGKGERVRGIDEVQETDQRAEVRPEPDPQPPVHVVVVPDDQPSQRLRGLPGATRPHRHLHARQDSHTQDLPHPDLPSASLAEDPRVHHHGLVPGV
mmetsp:Transcript_9140/g.25471  ORF Transcript_9140/g.25471 Transcript_9140/m.25471 type:complete len:213 (-) Transcript_9140:2208-2846(-)